MKERIRILVFALALILVMGAAVFLVRAHGGSISERIPDLGRAQSDRTARGLELRFGRDGITVLLPSCDPVAVVDRFFMHVYGAPAGSGAESFVNRDFDVAGEAKRKIKGPGGEVCVIDRAYGVANPYEIVIGQFSVSNGECCKVIWSRNYVIGGSGR